MINKQFALGTWEINLLDTALRTTLYSKQIFSYVDTAIDYNNDYLLTNIDKKIISKISSYHVSAYEFFISNHLKCLNRNSIDIMLIHSSRGNWQELAQKLKDDTRFKEIGVSNFNIDEIEEFKSIVGYYPKYNEIEINPLYTDIKTVEFCKANNIKIIAYGIVGGKYLATKVIAEYSLPYLLSYAQQHADIIILKPESTRHLGEYLDCITYCTNISVQYLPTITDASINADNKQIVPMRYTPPKIKKTFYGEYTYHNCCGKNTIINGQLKKTKLVLYDMPTFEMLGDYQTYIRYTFRQNYDNILKPVYEYDFLIGDNNCYYAVYIFDSDKNLTKVQQDNVVEVYMYEKA